jgi:hypothetical protein
MLSLIGYEFGWLPKFGYQFRPLKFTYMILLDSYELNSFCSWPVISFGQNAYIYRDRYFDYIASDKEDLFKKVK